jgi:hypothetical protein
VLRVVKGDKEELRKVPQTGSDKIRAENAEICVNALKLSVPTVIDREDNKVNRAYAGWPDRLYVVGKDGKVVYKGGPGPGGFKPDEVDRWLKKNLGPMP